MLPRGSSWASLVVERRILGPVCHSRFAECHKNTGSAFGRCRCSVCRSQFSCECFGRGSESCPAEVEHHSGRMSRRMPEVHRKSRKRVSLAEIAITEAVAAKERVVEELQQGERRLERLREEARFSLPTQPDPSVGDQMPERTRRVFQELRQCRDRHCGGVRGFSLATRSTGDTILGTPLGHSDFVKAQLRGKAEEHGVLLDRVEAVPDLQRAWLVLSFCCVTQAILRAIHPAGSEEFAGAHETAISRVFNRLLDIQGDQGTFNFASLPCRLGGVGLRNAVKRAQAICWSSWADSLHMIRKGHPEKSVSITVALSRGEGGPRVAEKASSNWDSTLRRVIWHGDFDQISIQQVTGSLARAGAGGNRKLLTRPVDLAHTRTS